MCQRDRSYYHELERDLTLQAGSPAFSNTATAFWLDRAFPIDVKSVRAISELLSFILISVVITEQEARESSRGSSDGK